MDFLLISTISIMSILVIFVFITNYFIRFTRWRLIDLFHLNKLFRKPRVKDLSKNDLNRYFAYFAWIVMDRRFMLRNGCKVMEIIPLSAQPGHKYVVISKDNRPFDDVCRVTVDTDIPGMNVTATVTVQSLKDFENMMNIMGWDIRDVFQNLREVDSGNKKVKQNIIDSYIDYMLRVVL